MHNEFAASSDTITIDGVGPMPVERPASVADVCTIVRRCAADKTAIYPFGGGTMLDYGLPPARVGVAVDLRALHKVIDFPARDMTITVEAGLTIARLNEITQAEKLQLPIDVPEPERATIGGAIACNVSGPRRYGYGTFRDYILGITTVNDRGEETKAGGRVVKNVAGYDLMKLHTGALGTLGIITQVTLKLKPVPEAWASQILFCGKPQFASLLDRLSQTTTRPTVVSFRTVIPDAASPYYAAFVVIFEGNRDSLNWQRRQARAELQIVDACVEDAAQGDGPKIDQTEKPDDTLIIRATLPTSAAAEFCHEASQVECMSVHGIAVGTVIRLSVPSYVSFPEEDAQQSVIGLMRVCQQLNGNLVIERCPTAWKKSLLVWGRPPSDLALQKAVKRALDPQNIFNPGRFVTDAF